MAGSTLYIGNLFKSLIDSFATLVARLDTQITSLSTINTSVSQTLNKLNVIASYNWKLLAPTHAISVASGSTGLVVHAAPVIRLRSFVDGVIRLRSTCKISNLSGGGGMYALINGTYYDSATCASITDVQVTYDIPVKQNDLIDIGAWQQYTGYTATMEANTVTVAYDIYDIVANSAVVKV